MELNHGRRDRVHNTDQEEDQVDVSIHRPSVPSSSSPSSSSTAFRRHDGRSGSGGSDGSHGGADNSFKVKEHMFDKVVTPSDVGKLNRLVIPKQHAEKYLPLDTSANQKGLLLSFEDRTGKLWRFRYCYWNSSQSYVITKGWSRFVKEKGLDAGDTVSFGRGAGEAGRNHLYIDWKRRPEDCVEPSQVQLPGLSLPRPVRQWSGRIFVPPAASCGHNWQTREDTAARACTVGGQLLYFRLPAARPPQMEVQQAGSRGVPRVPVPNSVPLVHEQATAKRVRLFGVNLDCPESGIDANYCNSCPSVSVAQLHHPRTTTALPLLRPPCSVGEKLASSSPTSTMSKEQHSPLDLYYLRRVGS